MRLICFFPVYYSKLIEKIAYEYRKFINCGDEADFLDLHCVHEKKLYNPIQCTIEMANQNAS